MSQVQNCRSQSKRFVIDSLARCGSTALARVLPLCGRITCLIEPFHPARYNGQYHKLVGNSESLRTILDMIWLRWNGIKHVWVPPEGFPFEGRQFLNDELVLRADAIIFLKRKNCLQRYVSSVLSRRLKFWIGAKQEYRFRLERMGFPELSVEVARKAIAEDRSAIERRELLLSSRDANVHIVYYEDLFGDTVTQQAQAAQINTILCFLGYSPVPQEITQSKQWNEIMNQGLCKWNSRDTYERIPGVLELERRIGSDETGWLLH